MGVKRNQEQGLMLKDVDAVITNFNQTELLFRAVDSVKKQTSPVNKIWIVDDGSEPQVVNQITEKYVDDAQVELLALKHRGIPGVSRKAGVSKSSASWIAFLDSDDYWHESKIEKQLLVAANNDAEFVFTNALKVGIETPTVYFPIQNFRQKLYPRQMIRVNYVINSSVLVRRSLLLEVDLYADLANVRAVEDYATWLRISLTTKFFGLAEPLTFFTVSKSSLSHESHIDLRPFALLDFLTWSKSKRLPQRRERVKHIIFRGRVLIQLVRETLL
jgi:glycosyltransferase involved in cell wall biosynthesis